MLMLSLVNQRSILCQRAESRVANLTKITLFVSVSQVFRGNNNGDDNHLDEDDEDKDDADDDDDWK